MSRVPRAVPTSTISHVPCQKFTSEDGGGASLLSRAGTLTDKTALSVVRQAPPERAAQGSFLLFLGLIGQLCH